MTQAGHPMGHSIPDRALQPVFVCQTCGFIRANQEAPAPNASPAWVSARAYRKQSGTQLSEMPFILTYCPDCAGYGQAQVPGDVNVDQAAGLKILTTKSNDGAGEGLIALVGAVFGQCPWNHSWKAVDTV